MSTQGVPARNPGQVRISLPSARNPVAASPASGSRSRQSGNQLDAADLVGHALRKEGRSGFADWSFAEPLRRLVDSLNDEGRLSAFGVRAARFDIQRCLANLLHLDAAEETQPDIAGRPVERPVFITGLPRSGSTFLHSLLAQDAANAVPRCWQMIYPYPSRNRFLPGDWRKRRVALQLGVYRYVAPTVAKLHPMSADGPQECSDITAHVFRSLRFDNTYHVPRYQEWIGRQSHVEAYAFHKRFLRHLDAQRGGRRWILKSPDHVFALDAIRAIYPDAIFVFLHRDPLPVLASQLNLIEALRRSFSPHVDRREIGGNVSAAIAEIVNRLLAHCARPGILHLSYRSVIAAPMDVVRRIYDHAGLKLGCEASGRMGRWLAGQRPRTAYAYPRQLSEYGLEPRAVSGLFDRYVQMFDVTQEQAFARRAA